MRNNEEISQRAYVIRQQLLCRQSIEANRLSLGEVHRVGEFHLSACAALCTNLEDRHRASRFELDAKQFARKGGISRQQTVELLRPNLEWLGRIDRFRLEDARVF